MQQINTTNIRILDGEYWYGGAVNDGYKFPVSVDDVYELDFDYNNTYNQINTVYVSSKGRYLWLDGGTVRFDRGVITVKSKFCELNVDGSCLKNAVINAAKRHYPPDGTVPAEIAFRRSQYCTWMALGKELTPEGVLGYAQSILDKGLKPGILILDDGWQQDFGVWDFHKDKFSDPGDMVTRLKAMGFKVVLWLVPYVSFGTKEYDDLLANRAILTDRFGEPMRVHWWNGETAVLDLTSDYGAAWLKDKTKRLVREYGIDGFKLDGGDSQFIGKDCADGNLQNVLWIDGVDSDIKEARSCYRLAGKAIIQRLADKAHIWGVDYVTDQNLPDNGYLKYGLRSVLPGILTQSIIGYYYGCPDMVGGGLHSDIEGNQELDAELIVRSCEIAAFMPMIQFSLNVWEIKTGETGKHCMELIELREQFVEYIIELAKHASVSAEPIVRYMEYVFPEQGFETVCDQAMLGDKYMLAPVVEPGVTARMVQFPQGRWKDCRSGAEYQQGLYKIESHLGQPPLFERVE